MKHHSKLNTLALIGGLALALGNSLAAPAFAAEDTPPTTVPSGGRGVGGEGALDPAPKGGRGMNSDGGAHAGAAKGMVDINSASAETLQASMGLSASDAQAVVQFRSKNGAIKSQAQLSQVPGLSEAGAARMKGGAAFKE